MIINRKVSTNDPSPKKKIINLSINSSISKLSKSTSMIMSRSSL